MVHVVVVADLGVPIFGVGGELDGSPVVRVNEGNPWTHTKVATTQQL